MSRSIQDRLSPAIKAKSGLALITFLLGVAAFFSLQRFVNPQGEWFDTFAIIGISVYIVMPIVHAVLLAVARFFLDRDFRRRRRREMRPFNGWHFLSDLLFTSYSALRLAAHLWIVSGFFWWLLYTGTVWEPPVDPKPYMDATAAGRYLISFFSFLVLTYAAALAVLGPLKWIMRAVLGQDWLDLGTDALRRKTPRPRERPLEAIARLLGDFSFWTALPAGLIVFFSPIWLFAYTLIRSETSPESAWSIVWYKWPSIVLAVALVLLLLIRFVPPVVEHRLKVHREQQKATAARKPRQATALDRERKAAPREIE